MPFYVLYDQVYFTEKQFTFWTLFYLLLEPRFQQLNPERYVGLKAGFLSRVHGDSANDIYFDADFGKDKFAQLTRIIDSIADEEPLTSADLRKDLFDCPLFGEFDRNYLATIYHRNAVIGNDFQEHFAFLRSAFHSGSFYALDHVDPSALLGEWKSIKESGQLRVHYNMTDVSPLDDKLRLSVTWGPDGFLDFKAFTEVVHMFSSGISGFMVHDSFARCNQGFLEHYSPRDQVFLYKRPLLEAGSNHFTTQLENHQFTFERI